MAQVNLHMNKIKKDELKIMQIHNQREHKNKKKHIDYSKTKDNYDLQNRYNIDYLYETRKKINLMVKSEKRIRKDAVWVANWRITPGVKFSNMKKFFSEVYKFFIYRYGKEKILSANIHLDEQEPHMHILVIPITQDSQLSCKRFFDRNELRSIHVDLKKHIEKFSSVVKDLEIEEIQEHVVIIKKLKEYQTKLRQESEDKEKEKQVHDEAIRAQKNNISQLKQENEDKEKEYQTKLRQENEDKEKEIKSRVETIRKQRNYISQLEQENEGKEKEKKALTSDLNALKNDFREINKANTKKSMFSSIKSNPSALTAKKTCACMQTEKAEKYLKHLDMVIALKYKNLVSLYHEKN